MLLISWNVAGWSSTVRAIRESYGSVARFFHLTGADIICLQECKGSWEKLQAKPIEMGAEDPPVSKRCLPKGAPPPLPNSSISYPEVEDRSAGVMGENMQDWESFWSFSDKVHKGFNGVVTFVRKGLTLACDARPFDKDDLNDEGRVVVTYHSAFVLFNVYVPNARGSVRSEYKKYFLNSLVSLMDRVRKATKKPLILMGDLNMTYRAEDAAWTLRRLDVGKMVELNRQCRALTDETWERSYPYLSKLALSRLTSSVVYLLWLRALEMLNTSDSSSSSPLQKIDDKNVSSAVSVDRESRKNSSQSSIQTSVVSVDSRIRDEYDRGASEIQKELQIEKLKKLRLVSTQSNSSKKELLCTTSSSQPSVRSSLESTNPSITLEELYKAGFSSVFVDEIATNANTSGSQNRDLYALTRYCGLPPQDDEYIALFCRLLHHPYAQNSTSAEGNFTTAMYDTFTISQVEGCRAEFSSFAYCPCPFTCWDQSRNRRQINEGTRLDYILVDAELAPYVTPPTGSENNLFNHNHNTNQNDYRIPTGPSHLRYDDEEEFFSEFSGRARAQGICRARADGLYPPAAFDRSGIPPLSRNALDIPFRGLPSTGLFLTPPQFSDHIGVCAHFRPCIILEPHREKISGSVKCLYRPPVSLRSFIMKPPPPKSAPATHIVEKAADLTRNGGQNSKLVSEEKVTVSPKKKSQKVEVGNGSTEIIDLDNVSGPEKAA